MAAPSRLPISLLTIVLLLVPGVIALEIYSRRSGKRFQLSRVQRIVYSVLLSLFSLLVLYLLTPLYFDPLTGSAEFVAAEINLVGNLELFNLSLSALVALYLLHVLGAIGLAYGAGYLDDEKLNKDEVLDRRPPWHYAFDETTSERVEVTLNSGEVIRGRFNEAAWSKSDHELYIENPEEVEYQDGELVGDPVDLGRSILLTESAISYVIFIEEDPDSSAEVRLDIDMSSIRDAIADSMDELIRDAGEQSDLEDFFGDEDWEAKGEDDSSEWEEISDRYSQESEGWKELSDEDTPDDSDDDSDDQAET